MRKHPLIRYNELAAYYSDLAAAPSLSAEQRDAYYALMDAAYNVANAYGHGGNIRAAIQQLASAETRGRVRQFYQDALGIAEKEYAV